MRIKCELKGLSSNSISYSAHAVAVGLLLLLPVAGGRHLGHDLCSGRALERSFAVVVASRDFSGE